MLLADQDRSLWDAAQIAAGRAVARPRDRAARARSRTCCRRRSHRCRPSEPLDWAQIAALYGRARRTHRLARGGAEPRGGGGRSRRAGGRRLRLVDQLALDDYRYLHSTRAELLRRLGRDREARAAYERALELDRHEGRAALPRPADRRALMLAGSEARWALEREPLAAGVVGAGAGDDRPGGGDHGDLHLVGPRRQVAQVDRSRELP